MFPTNNTENIMRELNPQERRAISGGFSSAFWPSVSPYVISPQATAMQLYIERSHFSLK